MNNIFLSCSGRVSSCCSTIGTRRVNLITNPVISHQRGKDREVFTTSGTHPWSFVTQILYSGQRINYIRGSVSCTFKKITWCIRILWHSLTEIYKEMISIFPLWTFHLYVATLQLHLHISMISYCCMLNKLSILS
jgi:hypothetical protein